MMPLEERPQQQGHAACLEDLRYDKPASSMAASSLAYHPKSLASRYSERGSRWDVLQAL